MTGTVTTVTSITSSSSVSESVPPPLPGDSTGASGASESAALTVPVLAIVTEPLASAPGRIAAARKIAAPSLEFDSVNEPVALASSSFGAPSPSGANARPSASRPSSALSTSAIERPESGGRWRGIRSRCRCAPDSVTVVGHTEMPVAWLGRLPSLAARSSGSCPSGSR